MDTSELYRITLKAVLEDLPRGTQSRIADDLGLDRSHFNAFLNGRRSFAENKREQIAEWLGYSYIDFLVMGRGRLASPNPKNERLPDPSVLLLIDGYEYIINIQKIIAAYTGISINLPSILKAKLITLYCSFAMNRIKREVDIDEKRLTDSIQFAETNIDDELFEEVAAEKGYKYTELTLKASFIFNCYIEEGFLENLKGIPNTAKENKDRQDAELIKSEINRLIKKHFQLTTIQKEIKTVNNLAKAA